MTTAEHARRVLLTSKHDMVLCLYVLSNHAASACRLCTCVHVTPGLAVALSLNENTVGGAIQQQAGHSHLQLTSKMVDSSHVTSSKGVCICCSSTAGINGRWQGSTSKALNDEHDCLCTVLCRKGWHLRLIGPHSCSSKAGNCRSHWLQLTLRTTKSSGNSDTLLLLLRKR